MLVPGCLQCGVTAPTHPPEVPDLFRLEFGGLSLSEISTSKLKRIVNDKYFNLSTLRERLLEHFL